MSFRIRFTEEARDDLKRLYDFLLHQAAGDWRQADAGLEAIRRGMALLETSPFACRRAAEVENAETVTVLALRHQREDDYR